MITASSSTLKASFLTSGESWLYLGPAQARVSTATRLNCMQPQLPGRLRARTIAAGSSCPCARLPSVLATSDQENPGFLQPPSSCRISHRRRSSCTQGRV